MKTTVIILLGFSGLASLQAEKVFSSDFSYDSDDSRIVGGYPAYVGQFPWQARVIKQIGNRRTWCSAVLIDAHWVLTLNYCIDNADLLTVYLGGVTTLSSEEGRIEVTSTNYVIRPKNYTSDVGLIYLRDEVQFNDRIRPIRIAESSEILPVGTRLVLSGYGRRADNVTDPSGLLHYIYVTTISNSECTAVYGKGVTEVIFCTKGDPLNSPCRGDGGGPLVLYDGAEEPILHGINAFINAAGCSTEYPVGHVNIETVSDWIRAVTGIK